MKRSISGYSDTRKGILYILASGLCFLVVNFFVKILGNGPQSTVLPTSSKIPAHELVFFRSLVSFSISYYFIKKNKLTLLGNNRKWLFIRGMAGMIALTLFFYTIHYLPIAIASTLQYLAPMFTVVLAVYILKEKVKTIQWFLISISLLGTFILGLSNFFETDTKVHLSWFWIFMGLVSALFSGLAYNSILKAKKTENTLNIVIYFPMLGIPIMGVWCLFDFVMPSGWAWIYLLIIGIFTQIAQVAMTKAFQLGNAATITPFQFVGSIYSVLIGYLIFDETLSFSAWIGMFFILAGVLINVFVRESRN